MSTRRKSVMGNVSGKVGEFSTTLVGQACYPELAGRPGKKILINSLIRFDKKNQGMSGRLKFSELNESLNR